MSKWPNLLHKMGFDDSQSSATVCLMCIFLHTILLILLANHLKLYDLWVSITPDLPFFLVSLLTSHTHRQLLRYYWNFYHCFHFGHSGFLLSIISVSIISWVFVPPLQSAKLISYWIWIRKFLWDFQLKIQALFICSYKTLAK